jgi:hypothetical protein
MNEVICDFRFAIWNLARIEREFNFAAHERPLARHFSGFCDLLQ